MMLRDLRSGLRNFRRRLGLRPVSSAADTDKAKRVRDKKAQGDRDRLARKDGDKKTGKRREKKEKAVARREEKAARPRYDAGPALARKTEPRLNFASPFRSDECLQRLGHCPICGGKSATLVSEYNRFVIFKDVDESFVRYDYRLCHDCGVVYASRRPSGPRLNFLLSNFNEVLTRVNATTTDPAAGNAILYPGPLSAMQREMIKARAAHGVFVSEHHRRPRTEYLSGLLRDLLSNSPHIELLSSLLDLRGAKVLEIRPRTGAILNALKERFGAEVYALPIFESQQLLVSEVYGIPAVSLINHESYAIPYDVKFDLIICNHQLTHAAYPQQLFAQIRNSMAPNGKLYLYNEVDDEEIVAKGKNMFRVLNPFHLQTFDGPSLVRALAANKFDTIFLTHINGELACLAVLNPETKLQAISQAELDQRLIGYRQARDRAILTAEESVKSRFETEWSTVVSRALAEGIASMDSQGRVKVTAMGRAVASGDYGGN